MRVIELVKKNAFLLIVLLISLIIRLFNADFQSVWLDEIHTINEANPNLSIGELYNSIMAGEQMPPLYFYLVYFTFKIFGYKTIVLRVLSAIIGTASIYAIYIFAKELMNKKIGMYAAILLTVNYFHIYYSQEGRPYILLFLFTVVAFYRLIKFIKLPNLNNTLFLGLYSALMIYSHFFGLFALFAQYVILLYFIVTTQKEKRKQMFINSAIAGFVTLILYIPSLAILLKVTEITSFWIQMPTLEVYSQILKGFFGTSEMVLIIINALFVLYFLRLSKEDVDDGKIMENKYIFSFIILIIWIVIVLLIPFIRTYLQVPMIVDRYFINILPAIIIVIAMGLDCIKNATIRNFIISLLIIFSLTDIIVVKNYYKKIAKTQFREASQFIINNNEIKSPVVTSLGWYFSFFLNNDTIKTKIIEKSLDIYVNEMVEDSIKRKPFWYIDAHNRPYKVTNETQAYLDKYFFIQNNMDGYDIWTKYYVLKTDATTSINIEKYMPLKQYNGQPFNFAVETFENDNNQVKIVGWAYFDKQAATDSEIDVLLIGNGKALRFQTQKVYREDVTTYFKSSFDLSNSGFSSTINISNLEKGQYQIAILIKDKINKKEGLNLTDKAVNK